MTNDQIALAPSTEIGSLGLMHLKRYWQKAMATRNGQLKKDSFANEWDIDKSLLAVAGLGTEQAIGYLYNTAPTFDEFERWILAVNGGTMEREKIDLFNAYFTGQNTATPANETENVLTEEDLAFWEENGYVILRNAISQEDAEITKKIVCDFIEVDLNIPATWYAVKKGRQGIMVQLFQHQMLDKNRNSPRIRKAFEQLWKRKDILCNNDRVGFNPPETQKYNDQGNDLHWDVSLHQPIPFGTQGILYLTDTAENQGAFTLVPGFQHRVGSWLSSLPAGANPHTENLHALGSKHIAANAGDFIIWHHALPHGSSPNTATLPRIVQYINYKPLVTDISTVWL
jgi:ectoine hydroxylase-related dioxygenase (phytanoyl-CoA dioxygenase family)